MTDIKVVIGANYGDEGKGLMTDYFCHQAMQKANKCLVICSNGGAQRGHTVETPEGIRHVFHHFGSGTLVGADTYLPDKFILNPIIFKQEYEELEKLGFTPKVYVNGKCIITTPYDMILNQYLEYIRGDNRHGSCGCGVWETIVRNKDKSLSFSFDIDSLLTSSDYKSDPKNHLNSYLNTIRNFFFYERLKEEVYNNLNNKEIDLLLKKNQWYELLYSELLMINYIDDLLFMISKIDIVEDNILKNYEQIVFENGQGLLLDENRIESGVHTTPSSTGIKNPLEIIEKVYSKKELESSVNFEACYVSRTYMTRHGAGDLPYECEMEDINPYMEPDLTNITNSNQGKLRYGYIDTSLLDKRIENDFKNCTILFYSRKKTTTVTHVNETKGKYKVNHGNYGYSIIETYVSDGKTRESIMSSSEFYKKYNI